MALSGDPAASFEASEPEIAEKKKALGYGPLALATGSFQCLETAGFSLVIYNKHFVKYISRL